MRLYAVSMSINPFFSLIRLTWLIAVQPNKKIIKASNLIFASFFAERLTEIIINVIENIIRDAKTELILMFERLVCRKPSKGSLIKIVNPIKIDDKKIIRDKL